MVKFFLFLYCRGSRNSSVQTYAQDHRNDVITNTFGLIAAIIGDRLYYWFDPLGAMILAAYIVQNWSVTALENIKAMVGLSAPPGVFIQTDIFSLEFRSEDFRRRYRSRVHVWTGFFCRSGRSVTGRYERKSRDDIGESAARSHRKVARGGKSVRAYRFRNRSSTGT